MEFAHVNRLKEEQQKGLHLCEEKISQWEKFKEDYDMLKQRLVTFPDALSYDITVPFGTQAFAKGKVVHTNEVMVLLGDNWFAEVSAKQAASIAERRIKQCVEMLADLNKEKEQLHNWSKYIEEVSGNEDLVEIVEKYDEEQEKQWREQHAVNVREHRQRVARERSSSGGSTCSEEELFQRLEESEGSFYECSDDPGEEKPVKLQLNCNGCSEEELLQRPEESEGSCSDEEKGSPGKLRLDCNGANDREEPTEGGGDCSSSPDVGGDCSSSLDSQESKHVRWQDLSKQNVKRITFKHTKNHIKNRHQHNIPVEDEDHRQKLQSPSDIYRQFGAFFQSSPPKSILKVKHSPSSESDEPFRFEQQPQEEDCPQKAFTGEVRETSSPIRIEQRKPRPASHFKNSRKNNRRK